MGKQKQLLEVMLFALKTILNTGKLAVVADSLFFEPSNNLFIGLLDCLCLIELDHHFIQTVLKKANSSHHWILFKEAHFILFNLLELVLQGKQHIFLCLCIVLLLIES